MSILLEPSGSLPVHRKRPTDPDSRVFLRGNYGNQPTIVGSDLKLEDRILGWFNSSNPLEARSAWLNSLGIALAFVPFALAAVGGFHLGWLEPLVQLFVVLAAATMINFSGQLRKVLFGLVAAIGLLGVLNSSFALEEIIVGAVAGATGLGLILFRENAKPTFVVLLSAGALWCATVETTLCFPVLALALVAAGFDEENALKPLDFLPTAAYFTVVIAGLSILSLELALASSVVMALLGVWALRSVTDTAMETDQTTVLAASIETIPAPAILVESESWQIVEQNGLAQQFFAEANTLPDALGADSWPSLSAQFVSNKDGTGPFEWEGFLADGRLVKISFMMGSAKEQQWTALLFDQSAAASAGQELDLERRRFSQLFELSPAAHFILDSDGQLIAGNRSFSALLEISREVISGEGWLNAIEEKDRRSVHVAVQRSVAGSMPFDVEFLLADADERIHAQAAPLMHDGALTGFVGLLDRVETHDEIEPEPEPEVVLESPTPEPKPMAQQVMHSLLDAAMQRMKQPLEEIVGYSQLAVSGEVSADAELQLKAITERGQYLQALLEEVLHTATEPGMIESVEIVAEIRKVARGLNDSIQSRGVSIEYDLPEEAVELQTERASFRQLITILIGNALINSVSGSTVLIQLQEFDLVVTDYRNSAQHKASPLPGVVERELLARRGLVSGELGIAIANALTDKLHFDLKVEEDPALGVKSTLSLAESS